MQNNLERGFVQETTRNFNMQGYPMESNQDVIREEDRYFEPQRREYLDLIHLLNETARNILNEQKNSGAFNKELLQFVMDVNYKAYTAGLYQKIN